jgi:hypothetical protein
VLRAADGLLVHAEKPRHLRHLHLALEEQPEDELLARCQQAFGDRQRGGLIRFRRGEVWRLTLQRHQPQPAPPQQVDGGAACDHGQPRVQARTDGIVGAQEAAVVADQSEEDLLDDVGRVGLRRRARMAAEHVHHRPTDGRCRLRHPEVPGARLARQTAAQKVHGLALSCMKRMRSS